MITDLYRAFRSEDTEALWNDEFCDNGNAMKQCYGVTAQKKVCSCASIFNFICGPPEFSVTGKFIQKNYHFCDFGGCKPTFLSHNGEIWCEGADLGLPSPSQMW